MDSESGWVSWQKKMGWSGKGWADCCGGKKHGKNPERSRSSHGTMIPNMMDFLWISWFPVWPWFVSLGAAGPREVPFVSWQHGAAHWSWFTFSLSTNIQSRYTFHYPAHTHQIYIHIIYSIINRRAIYFWYFFCGRFWNYFWVPGSMLSCFSAFLFFAFPASLLVCFSACLLLCFTCFFSFLLLCFPCFSALLLLCFTCFFFFLLLCFPCFSAFLLLCLSTSTILLFLFFRHVFLLLYFLLLCFSASCLYCIFVFSFLLLYPLLFVNTLYRWNPKKP